MDYVILLSIKVYYFIADILSKDIHVDEERASHEELLVVIASGKYLFPFRTEKSSRSAQMVLPRKGGRVCHCQQFYTRVHYRRIVNPFFVLTPDILIASMLATPVFISFCYTNRLSYLTP